MTEKKPSKYFASLEKKRSETKLISRLCVNNAIITNQKEILTVIQTFYKNQKKNNGQLKI